MPSQSSTRECPSYILLLFQCLSVSLDPDQKDALIEVIEKLLKDQTTVIAVTILRVGLVLFSVTLVGGWQCCDGI